MIVVWISYVDVVVSHCLLDLDVDLQWFEL